MKLVTHTFLTLDGVMQGPGGAEEDPSGGFGRGGWLVPFSDADMGVIVESWFARTEAILLGRNTFETMRAYWSQVADIKKGGRGELPARRCSPTTRRPGGTTCSNPAPPGLAPCTRYWRRKHSRRAA